MEESPQSDPLIPELRDAERTLDAALDEACDSKPAGEVDTGELIRVEEMLEIASQAAKRAVSLRRRRRADGPSTRPRGGKAVMADAEAAASPDAAHRTVTDAAGVTWDVFAVYPEARVSPHSQLKGPFAQGWLCYDSGGEKRRLSPIPENWQSLGEAELARFGERAEVAGRRKRPSSEVRGPNEESRGE